MLRLSLKSANVVAWSLAVFGCSQIVGYLTDSRALRGVGAAAAMAPFPKVFSDVDGLETFASSFVLHWRDASGAAHALPITAELYANLEGAYNRRNVYGAALSYAPRLPESLWSAVFQYAFAPTGPLRREFGLPADAHDFTVEIRTNTKGRSDQWMLKPAAGE